MITKYLAAALLSTAFMTGVASAQTATTNTTDRATTAMMASGDLPSSLASMFATMPMKKLVTLKS
jgi:hypothetical protein